MNIGQILNQDKTSHIRISLDIEHFVGNVRYIAFGNVRYICLSKRRIVNKNKLIRFIEGFHYCCDRRSLDSS